MPSDSGSGWAPPASNGERRLSNSSDGSAGSGYSKTTSDSADFLATRPHTAAVIPGKPAGNPLQFVRVGPADLGSRAREQLRRAELAKQTEPARVERPEDWQSNLDNWKSSRRKRVEHIIDRCVEVRRMENEPSQARTKSKTFNEMLEERAGRRRRNPLALYTDDDGNDLSDLGIGTSSTKSSLSEDCDTHSLASDGVDLDKNHSDVDNLSNCDNNRKIGSSANEYDTCTTTTISSPEPEEYTYEGAIEGYKSRISSQTNRSLAPANNHSPPNKTLDDNLNRIRTSVSNKIDQNITSFQHEKTNDTKPSQPIKDLPKVDISKRREHFQRENSQEQSANKPKLTDIANKTSIKDRLSNLAKFTEETQIQKSASDLTKLAEVKSLKERFSFLETNKPLTSENDKAKKVLNDELSNAQSLKERLSSLKSQTSDESKMSKTDNTQVSMSIQERLNCLESTREKDIPKINVSEELANNDTISFNSVPDNDISLKSSLSGIENQMQSFCRSLDSLDINGQSSPNSFGRVQSLEDFDCGEMQNNTVPSDIETEDSGIHTARDSCVPADDIADLTQMVSPVGEAMIEISEYNYSNDDSTEILEPTKIEEPCDLEQINQNIVRETILEEPEEHTENSDSGSNYTQAVSQQEDISVTEVTEIPMEKDDDDTLKSLDNQDSVIDALELAFIELDSENSVTINPMDRNDKPNEEKTETTQIEESKPKDEPKKRIAPLYENVFYNNNVVDAAEFPLDMPTNILEPPKEKPPPPPCEDIGDDELLGNGNFKHTSSARRIKKEIRNKRTSFLGIEGQVDDSYLDADLAMVPRPDITSFLKEESKIEKLLYKKTLSQDLDVKLRESRDSGVDFDRGPSAEAWYKGQSSPETSNQHSRQNSEPYTHVTVTSDEEEAARKHKEQTFNDNLQSKLCDLSEAHDLDDSKIQSLDQKLQQQQEVLRFERELLQLEQEELRRQRENLLKDHSRIIQKSTQDIMMSIPNAVEKPPLQSRSKAASQNQNYRHSMPNLLLNENYTPAVATIPERPNFSDNLKRKPFVSEEHIQRHFGVEESRKVLYDDRVANEVKRRQTPSVIRPPQPILPPKPRSRDSIEREITMRSSRVPSAGEYVNVDRTAVQLRQKPVVALAAHGNNVQYHPMTRHTLQALSAAPTPKLISNADWLQQRNKKPVNYNYNQHWLIQEAEQRRIEEQRSKIRANPRHSYHQDMVPPTVHNLHPLIPSPQKAAEYKRRPQEAPRQEPPREEKLLSVSGRRKCSHCSEELGRGAAMIIESLSLCYHVWCFTCAVCGARLGDGRAGADVRVRGNRLHCHHCYSGDDGRKYSCV